uniref:Uncharacterized protein n=1 Tax=Arundo donax TaxID=35708 RepID=A0A0A9HEK3_ARUDO
MQIASQAATQGRSGTCKNQLD